MDLSNDYFEQLRARLRFKVAYDVGFACPDIEDIVQEALARLMTAARDDKILNPAAIGAFLNGICRNVISEYRRRNMREDPMPEVVPEPPDRGIRDADLLELREAIDHGLAQLSERDRRVLRAFYLEEKSKEEILNDSGMSDENFRVVLCRAKERFRAIFLDQAKHPTALRHSST
ncbi:MAG TPA: sigma-70 family RNA polymerase sigma factor [Bryobacteraceae bacterium]|nr:sigma-70 family RNA polymerase sigma factor [Bryobacteraceae bacterium]